MRFEVRSQDIRLTALVRLPREGWALLRKEKDEASLPICFRQDSLNAFILRFAGTKAFLLPLFRAGLSETRTLSVPHCGTYQQKDPQIQKQSFMSRALAGALFLPNLTSAQVADAVVTSTSGTGFQPGFDTPGAALGEPSRVTPGQFGGPVDPFNPPYLSSQLVSLGAGGSLTVRFNSPILNNPSHPFGLDFNILGNTGFIITNAFDPDTFQWIGTPPTDGSLFGSVHLHRAESGESSTAVLNWPLTSGDVLSTAAGARAEVQIGSNLLQIASGSVLELMQLDDQRVALRLLEGSVIARLPSPEAASEFEFITRDGRFQVREAGRYRFDSDRSTTAGTVYAGALRFSAADSSLDIGAGQRAQFWSEGRTRYQVSAPVNDEFALWSAAREPRRGAAQALLVSPEMTGVGDLDAHGNWYESPEYGAVWFPRALPADWAPYRSGRWVWVDPWGWSWVGDEPWGFAPFHYGRWALFRGAWGWVPGKRVARPVYAPALVAWVGTPAAHRPAHTGGRPAVGWFPLAPREVYIPAYRSSAGHVRQVNAAHVKNINHLTEITVNPQAVAARSRYVHQHLPQAVTAVPEEAMRQRRHVREAALQPAERALLTSQPVQVRAPVAGRDREEVRRQMGQMQPAEERTRPAAGGALPDGQPGRRGDAQATPPVGLSGATAAAALTRPRSAVPPPASANAVSMLPATPPTTVAATP